MSPDWVRRHMTISGLRLQQELQGEAVLKLELAGGGSLGRALEDAPAKPVATLHNAARRCPGG